MRKLYIFTMLFFIGFCAHSQIIVIPDANFKAKLLAANSTNYIAYVDGVGYTNIDTNGNNEIEISEALLIKRLNVENSAISSLEGISGFSGLTSLICQNNNLTSLNLGTLAQLIALDCSGNQLTSLNDSQLASGVNTLDCSYNLLTEFNVSVSFKVLDCSHNQLTWLNLSYSNNLMSKLNCSFNNLSGLDLPNFAPFLDQGMQEMSLDCSNNQISTINFDQTEGFEEFSSLNLSHNNFTDLTLANMTVYGAVNVSYNPLDYLNFSNFSMSGMEPDDNVYLLIENTNLTQITAPGGESLYLSIKNNPNLVSLNLKNGKPNVHSYIYYVGEEDFIGYDGVILENNPALAMICCDESEIVDYLLALVPGAQVSEYCTFTPGGSYNTITGTVNLNCPNSSPIETPIKVSLNGSNVSYTNMDNIYNLFTGSGNKTVVVNLPEPTYFTVTPANYVVNFVGNGNLETANFCLSPNGYHPDLESTVAAVNAARPGFDASYNVTYTNKGTETQSGTVTLNFEDGIIDFISANPPIDAQAANTLTWNFTNLQPFESRTIALTFNINSPLETPAVNNGDLLHFTSIVTSVLTDEKPADNTANLVQTVVGSYDPNDKVVAEGSSITPEQLGEYLHYTIRFQNTGTFAAENVVVKDNFELSSFNSLSMQSIEIIAASHQFYARINSNFKIEFIFQGINLPPSSQNEIGSHGFITFKIKPKATLPLGTVISNSAAIYFDFNSPIITEPAVTTVSVLGTKSFTDGNLFTIYPNPASTILNIQSDTAIDSTSIINNLGQVIMQQKGSDAINVSELASGVYFVKVICGNKSDTKKFFKL